MNCYNCGADLSMLSQPKYCYQCGVNVSDIPVYTVVGCSLARLPKNRYEYVYPDDFASQRSVLARENIHPHHSDTYLKWIVGYMPKDRRTQGNKLKVVSWQKMVWMAGMRRYELMANEGPRQIEVDTPEQVPTED